MKRATLGVLVMVLSACAAPAGGPATAAPAATATPRAAAAAVDVQGFAFQPATLEVSKGSTVTWTNRDSVGHTVASGTPAKKDGRFGSPLDGQGKTFSFSFSEAGTYDYFCEIHGASMTGKIVVK